MPWCSNCNMKYSEGSTKCEICGSTLVQEASNNNRNKKSEPVLLASGLSQSEATMIGARLKDAGIPYFIKDRSIGGYMKIYMGFTVYGQDIFVSNKSLKEAQDLLSYSEDSEGKDFSDVDMSNLELSDIELNNSNLNNLSSGENDVYSDHEDNVEIHSKRQRIIASIIILFIIISFIGIAVLNYLNRLGLFQ